MNEEWRVIAAFPDYAVSSEGRVRRIVPDYRGNSGNILKVRNDRYSYVTLYREKRPHVLLVHRLVCAAFHGPQPTPKHEVAHGDGNGTSNAATNLRWATHSENEADKKAHGSSRAGKASNVPLERRAKGNSHGRITKPERTARGERNGLSKLTEEKVKAIRGDTRPRKVLSAEYGVSVSMISYIQRGVCWAHVPMPRTQGAQL